MSIRPHTHGEALTIRQIFDRFGDSLDEQQQEERDIRIRTSAGSDVWGLHAVAGLPKAVVVFYGGPEVIYDLDTHLIVQHLDRPGSLPPAG